LDYKFLNIEKDDAGNLLILQFKTNNSIISLVCLYGRNKDTPNFCIDIKQRLIHLDNPLNRDLYI